MSSSPSGPDASPPDSAEKVLRCRSCESGRLIRAMFIFKEGEPPGHPDHQIVYNDLQLHACDQCRRGVLIRMKHDCFDWEAAWDNQDSYWIDAQSMEKMNGALAACPQPQDPACGCELHLLLLKSLENLPELGANGDFGLVPRLRYDSAHGGWLVPSDGCEQVDFNDGRVRLRAYVSGGLLSGHAWRYHPSGTLAEEGEFSRDRRTGKWCEFNDAGKPIAGSQYEAGQRIGSVAPVEAAAEAAKRGKAKPHPKLDFLIFLLILVGIPCAVVAAGIWVFTVAWRRWPGLAPAGFSIAFLFWIAYMFLRLKKRR